MSVFCHKIYYNSITCCFQNASYFLQIINCKNLLLNHHHHFLMSEFRPRIYPKQFHNICEYSGIIQNNLRLEAKVHVAKIFIIPNHSFQSGLKQRITGKHKMHQKLTKKSKTESTAKS
ncbi:MAG: hypothetical protein MHMPM18_000768 [Marteilia pararefringens]